MKIDLYDGKYTYVCNDDGSDQHVQRYGERWRDLTGDGFVLAMAHKIEEQQERIEELEKREAHLLQDIYSVAKVSFEAGFCSNKPDFHNEAVKFANYIAQKT